MNSVDQSHGSSQNAAEERKERDPLHEHRYAIQSLIAKLDSLREMVSIVLPILKERDSTRGDQIVNISKRLQSHEDDQAGENLGKNEAPETSDGPNLRDIHELLKTVRKLGEASRMFRQGVIVSSVSQFDSFIEGLMERALLENPEWLFSSDRQISYREVLELESLDQFKESVIAREIGEILRDSHYRLIKYIDERLKLGVLKEFPRLSSFLELTERRNVFVHADGRASAQYFRNLNRWDANVDPQTQIGDYLSADEEYIEEALNCLTELAVWISQAFIRRQYSSRADEADTVLNNLIVELLNDERWLLAERLLDFALTIPEKYISDGEIRYYYHINKAIALKFAGKDFKEFLHSIDWTPYHPKYHLAVAILEQNYEEACKLLRTDAVQEEIGEDELKAWPLFREFRRSNEFLVLFEELYGKDFYEEVLGDLETKLDSKARRDEAEAARPEG